MNGIYRVYFKVEFYCGGIISYADGHTSLLGYSDVNAKENFKKNFRIGDASYDEFKGSIRITKVELIKELDNIEL